MSVCSWFFRTSFCICESRELFMVATSSRHARQNNLLLLTVNSSLGWAFSRSPGNIVFGSLFLSLSLVWLLEDSVAAISYRLAPRESGGAVYRARMKQKTKQRKKRQKERLLRPHSQGLNFLPILKLLPALFQPNQQVLLYTVEVAIGSHHKKQNGRALTVFF